jgi:hypothetical protein
MLASKIYSIIIGMDIAYTISSTLKLITIQLELLDIVIIIYTNSYSFYECLVKLGTTKEKRLMINIIALQQSYKRKELFEVRWINGQDNPANTITKASPNKAFERFIDTNKLQVRIKG